MSDFINSSGFALICHQVGSTILRTSRKMPSKWGEDLVWNWEMDAHSLKKLAFNFAMGWENDHEKIMRVANSIIKGNS